MSEREKSAITRTERPPSKPKMDAVDEFMEYIDKLIRTLDSEDDDCPTEQIELLETQTVRPRSIDTQVAPPPPPPGDDTAELELITDDSLMPTQF